MKRSLTIVSSLSLTLLLAQTIFSQTTSREQLGKQLEEKRAELMTLEQQFLSPSEEDKASYAQLLAQPHTGMIRLMPREKFDTSDKSVKKTITMRGGGAYYSFANLTQEYNYGSDIELEQNHLSVGFAGYQYGMFLKLTDSPLEDITIDHGGVKTMVDYVPPSAESEIRTDQRRFSEGNELDGVKFKNRVPVEVGATYVLRSIDFERSDVLVAFNVIRKDDDGSVVLAWKMLKRFAPPKVLRANQATSQIR